MPLPIYRQLPQGCGLSTFLMLINPERNQKVKIFLDQLFEDIKFLTYAFKPNYLEVAEFRWSIALGYLLLKCFGNNLISRYLSDKLGEIYDTYKLIFIQKIKNVDTSELRRLPIEFIELYLSFFETGLINPFVLRRELLLLREDVDLKSLFSIFGGNFYPQEQEIPDGTGALYFTKNDKKNDAANYYSKIDILKAHLANFQNGNIPCIAVNTGGHWVAVSSIEEKRIILNNPSSRKPVKISITRHIPEIFRFYLFDYRPRDAFILKNDFTEFLQLNIEKEQKNLQNFIEILKNSLKEKDV
ncbi:MAG: hypothetical protein ACTSR8_03725 [Promethearchaeota archaeon]